MTRARSSRILVLAAAVSAAAAGSLVAPPPTDAAPPPWTVVASGLNNPRLLTISPTGIYVGEAGFGGSGACHTGGDGTKLCYGPSGSITRIAHGHQGRILTGLPSFAATDGSQAIGPNEPRRSGRKLLISLGLEGPPAIKAGLPRKGRFMGTLTVATKRHGSWNHLHVLANLAKFERLHDPDGRGPDTDPTGYVKRGKRVVIADSGGNDVLSVKRSNGKIRVVTVIGTRTEPNPFAPPATVAMESVPTSTAIGPDGALYVSELTGFPFVPGAARIFRIAGGQRTVWATGLTNVTDIAWAGGKLYAVQISDVGLINEGGLPSGSLVQVHHTGSPTTVMDNLPAPYGVAIRNGSAFVTTCAVCKGGGQVVRFPLP